MGIESHRGVLVLSAGLSIKIGSYIIGMKNKPWFLYVVKCNDDTLYTGVTTDVDRRLNEHNSSAKGSKYTKVRRPVELVYWTDFKDRSTAQKAEYKFKKLMRKQKEEIISER